MPGTASDLDFYRALRRLNDDDAGVRAALGFARAYADLAARVLAARAAQSGEPLSIPPALPLPALRAYLDGGPHGLARQFTGAAHRVWADAPVALLADLAEWFAGCFSPTDPLAHSLQVWVGSPGTQALMLCGRPLLEPPPPFRLVSRPPLEDLLPALAERPAALLAHYDVHGLAMLALSLRYLRTLGFPGVDCATGFEWTGDVGKLWKRAVPKTIAHPKGYGLVALIDCSVHSRKPDVTLKALSRLDAAPKCHLVIVDHHLDTALQTPRLSHPRATVVLTDVPGCGLVAGVGPVERELMILGALGDKVPEVHAACPRAIHPELHAAVEDYSRRAIHFSPTPPDIKQVGGYPLRRLWEALADGERATAGLAERLLGTLPPPPEERTPEHERVGSLVVVTERLDSVGRTWYGLLERLMARENAAYACAMRVLDERRANILLVTDWRNTSIAPVRLFVPQSFLPRCLGHPTAVWADLERGEALGFLDAVATRINQFQDTPASFRTAERLLSERIVNALPQPTLGTGGEPAV